MFEIFEKMKNGYPPSYCEVWKDGKHIFDITTITIDALIKHMESENYTFIVHRLGD
jgi:hypothetical protein